MNVVQSKLVRSFSAVTLVALSSLTALAGCEDAATVSQLDSGAGADGAVDTAAGSDVAVAETDVVAGTDAAAETDVVAATDAAAETDAVAATDAVATTDVVVGTDASGPDASTTCSSAEKKLCNDGLSCTIDTCTMPGAACSWKLAEDTCLIGGICRGAGDAKPGDPCQVCDPKVSQSAWSPAAVGAPCDDGDLCTYDGSCQDVTMGPAKKTVCVSKPTPCDDGNDCTTDTCSPKTGCAYPAAKGKACDDGDACTSGDACGLSGACTGTDIVCNDNNLCTDDACDLATGCTATANSAPCSDNDACTSGDVCSEGKCATGAAANCDDGNTCTLDICDKKAGCYHLPVQSACCTGQTNVCDDGNPCTSEDCDPNTGGCGTPAPNTALCNDNNACTQSDTCTGGSCKGSVKVCNDNNPCTNDACTPSSGCVFNNADGVVCDDGDACTNSDACSGGSCKGSGKCECVPVFSDQVSKLTSILIGSGGKPGQGLDLDNDPATCAPSADCAGGINNSLGSLSGFANGPLQDAVAGGSVTILLEYPKLQQGPVDVALYLAKQDFTAPPCDAALMSCQYLIDPSLYVFPTCSALVALPGTLAGNVLLAGGPGTNFPFSLPLSAGVDLNITIYGARIQGTVVITDGKVVSIDAILAGAVPKTSLLAAVEALPEEGLPIPKDGIKGILESVVENDIDSDGDGTKDAASIGLKIKGIGGQIVGFQP